MRRAVRKEIAESLARGETIVEGIGSHTTWTLGPKYPVASCRRCGAEADAKDVATGFCWRCGYLGAVEFKDVVRPR